MKKLEELFSGKVVSFSCGTDTLAMEFLKTQTLGDRTFLLGRIPSRATNNDWAKDRICAVCWDNVTDLIIFDSLEQYIEGMDLTED